MNDNFTISANNYWCVIIHQIFDDAQAEGRRENGLRHYN